MTTTRNASPAGGRWRAARRRAGVPVLALVLALGVAACSGDDDEPEGSGTGGASPTQQAEVVTDVRFGRIEGRLPRENRAKVRARVQQVFDDWVDAAYVGGEWPRTDFSGAFPAFTRGARAQARKDAALMSNKAIGAKIDGVETLSRALRIDVVAVRGRVAGATARFQLRFRISGEVEQVSTVRGRLMLAPQDGAWQVFGYDVSRGEGR